MKNKNILIAMFILLASSFVIEQIVGGLFFGLHQKSLNLETYSQASLAINIFSSFIMPIILSFLILYWKFQISEIRTFYAFALLVSFVIKSIPVFFMESFSIILLNAVIQVLIPLALLEIVNRIIQKRTNSLKMA